MSEAEWLACEDPMPMLLVLLAGRVTPATGFDHAAAAAMRRRSGTGRKFRLYGCAWCRRFLDRASDPRLGPALDLAEHYADRSVGQSAFATAILFESAGLPE